VKSWKMLALLTVVLILSLVGCQHTQPTTTPSQPPQFQGSSIYLQGGEVSFSLDKGEIRSVIVFLEEDENAYIDYIITPTLYSNVVQVDSTAPDGMSSCFASTSYIEAGGEGKGYYSINFDYFWPSRIGMDLEEWLQEDVPQEERQLWRYAPDSFEVYFSCEITTEWK